MLLVLDLLDLLSREKLLLLSQLTQEGVDPRFEVFWSMSTRLDDNLTSKNLVLAAKLTLNNVPKLLLVSELIEEWLVEQGDEDLKNGRLFVGELS